MKLPDTTRASLGQIAMMKSRIAALPFFDDTHLDAISETEAWLGTQPEVDSMDESNYIAESKHFAQTQGRAGLLRYMVPTVGDTHSAVDVRAITLIREALAYRSALADSAFVTQGLCATPICHFGTAEQRERYVTAIVDGSCIPAFALSEPDGGSDVAATRTTATADGDGYVLNGVKTWTSNAGIADLYIVVARTGEAAGSAGLSAFLVEADAPGLRVGEQIVVIGPHPMASLHLDNVRVRASSMLGEPGKGFMVAMSVLDIFRTTVGGAALGLARRAFDETVARVRERKLFGTLMSEMQTVQMKIAEMHVDLEVATTAVYNAAWIKDHAGTKRMSSVASLAKLFSTEAAFRVIDSAVQLFGGRGVTRGCVIERLYRDIRPMRIYEGASEIQKLIIGRHVLRN